MHQLDLEAWANSHCHKYEPETSLEAAKRARAFVGDHHRIILDALSDFGPSTGDEIASVTELDKPQIMRRMNELVRAGRVRDSGKRRNTPKGRPAAVWRLC